jgi:hypothetical protein
MESRGWRRYGTGTLGINGLITLPIAGLKVPLALDIGRERGFSQLGQNVREFTGITEFQAVPAFAHIPDHFG